MPAWCSGKVTRLAVRYQLVSPHTCVLVVARREGDEKPEELPDLRRVAHMLAAGWGGMGTVQEMAAPPDVGHVLREPTEPLFQRRVLRKEALDVLGPILPSDTDADLFVPADDFVGNLCHCLGSRKGIVDVGKKAEKLLAFAQSLGDNEQEARRRVEAMRGLRKMPFAFYCPIGAFDSTN